MRRKASTDEDRQSRPAGSTPSMSRLPNSHARRSLARRTQDGLGKRRLPHRPAGAPLHLQTVQLQPHEIGGPVGEPVAEPEVGMVDFDLPPPSPRQIGDRDRSATRPAEAVGPSIEPAPRRFQPPDRRAHVCDECGGRPARAGFDVRVPRLDRRVLLRRFLAGAQRLEDSGETVGIAGDVAEHVPGRPARQAARRRRIEAPLEQLIQVTEQSLM